MEREDGWWMGCLHSDHELVVQARLFHMSRPRLKLLDRCGSVNRCNLLDGIVSINA